MSDGPAGPLLSMEQLPPPVARPSRVVEWFVLRELGRYYHGHRHGGWVEADRAGTKVWTGQYRFGTRVEP